MPSATHVRPYYKHPRIRAPGGRHHLHPKAAGRLLRAAHDATVGAGKKVAVIELGGGFDQAVLTAFFASLGYPGVAAVVFHSVDGASQPATATRAATTSRCMLDLSVVGGMAPGCKMHCYMAAEHRRRLPRRLRRRPSPTRWT